MNLTSLICGDPSFERSALGQRVRSENMQASKTAPLPVRQSSIKRSPRFAQHKAEIQRLWAEGVPQRRICAQFGIHNSTLLAAVIEEGWPLR